MTSRLRRFLAAGVLITFLVSLTSCGYFLYPERRGQTKGEIDLPILLLDGSSLLFAAVTGAAVIAVAGVVALAVDFTSGCIYLPGKGKKAGVEVVPFDNTRPLAQADLESILSGYTGSPVHLEPGSITLLRIGKIDPDNIGELLSVVGDNPGNSARL